MDILHQAEEAAARLTQIVEGDVPIQLWDTDESPSSINIPSPSIELNDAIFDAVRTTLTATQSVLSGYYMMIEDNVQGWEDLDRAEIAMNRAREIFFNEVLQHEVRITRAMQIGVQNALRTRVSSRTIHKVLNLCGRITIHSSVVHEFNSAMNQLRSSAWARA